ncbi:MAG: hypothetical protein GXP45_03860 [bacterium]|nr:hypothetical protein [bacterium]
MEQQKLRQFITMLLKSQTATQIKKINYISNYQLQEKKIIKTQEKLLAIFYSEKKEEKLLSLLNLKPEIQIISQQTIKLPNE